MAGLYENTSHYDEARKRLAKVRASDSKNLDALLASGKVEIGAGKPDAGLEFLNSAYSLARSLAKTKPRLPLSNRWAWRTWDSPSSTRPLKNFQEALEIRKLGLENGVAGSLNMIATVEKKLGKDKEALADYKESLARYRKIGDKQHTAVLLMNLGSFYSDHAQYEDALKSTNEALSIFRELGEEQNQAQSLNNLGTIRSYMGNFQDALTYYQQAYEIRDRLKLTDGVAESLHNLAEANVALGQYETAVNQFLKVLDISRNGGDMDGVALNSVSLGMLYLAQGQWFGHQRVSGVAERLQAGQR